MKTQVKPSDFTNCPIAIILAESSDATSREFRQLQLTVAIKDCKFPNTPDEHGVWPMFVVIRKNKEENKLVLYRGRSLEKATETYNTAFTYTREEISLIRDVKAVFKHYGVKLRGYSGRGIGLSSGDAEIAIDIDDLREED